MTQIPFIDRHIASGRTTRLADKYIQKLFDNPGEWVRISDHFPGRKADEMLMVKVCRRVEMEHHITLDVDFCYCSLRIPSDVAQRMIEFRNNVLLKPAKIKIGTTNDIKDT